MTLDFTRIIVVRHGETAWNADTRIQGHTDIDLNDAGRAQAARLGRALLDESIGAVYASDLARARQTAQPVADLHGLAVNLSSGLRERAFGEFEGRTFDEILRDLPEQAQRWRSRDPEFAPHGGETLLQFRLRVLQAMGDIARRHAGEQIVCVAHGGVLDLLYRAATGLDLQAPRTWQVPNAAVNRMLWTADREAPGLSLIGWGDVSHLEGSLDEQHD